MFYCDCVIIDSGVYKSQVNTKSCPLGGMVLLIGQKITGSLDFFFEV